MTRNPRVAVIDQDLSSRSDINKLLSVSGFTVVGEAGYGIEAVSLAKQAEPDVVVIAIEEPMIRALQTVEALADLLPHSAIVGYSTIRDAQAMRKSMLAGVSDFIQAPIKEEELINSIYTVLASEERRRARISGEAGSRWLLVSVITVFGAKGGIGKTTIATNLATAIVRRPTSPSSSSTLTRASAMSASSWTFRRASIADRRYRVKITRELCRNVFTSTTAASISSRRRSVPRLANVPPPHRAHRVAADADYVLGPGHARAPSTTSSRAPWSSPDGGAGGDSGYGQPYGHSLAIARCALELPAGEDQARDQLNDQASTSSRKTSSACRRMSSGPSLTTRNISTAHRLGML